MADLRSNFPLVPVSTSSVAEECLQKSQEFLRRNISRPDLNLKMTSRSDVDQWLDYTRSTDTKGYFDWYELYEKQSENDMARLHGALVSVRSNDQLCALVAYGHLPGSEEFQIFQAENMGQLNPLSGLISYIYTNTALVFAQALDADFIKANGPFYLTEKQKQRMSKQGFTMDGDGNMVLSVPHAATGFKPDLFINPDVVSL